MDIFLSQLLHFPSEVIMKCIINNYTQLDVFWPSSVAFSGFELLTADVSAAYTPPFQVYVKSDNTAINCSMLSHILTVTLM